MTKSYYLLPDDENYVSKTDLKKEVKELQEFGKQLVKLSNSQRQQLTCSDELQEAFLLADKIANKPDALRRHMQFVTKLLRDEDVEQLKLDYTKLTTNIGTDKKVIHKLEKLRESLLDKGDEAINKLLEQHPQIERQRLRQLVRQAKKEVANQKPGKQYKELFQLLKNETLN